MTNRYFEEELNKKQVKVARFSQTILWLLSGYLIIWLGIIAISGVDWVTNTGLYKIAEQITDMLLLLFSFIVLALGYFSIKNPEILLIQQRYKDSNLEEEEGVQLQTRLAHLLNQEKVTK